MAIFYTAKNLPTFCNFQTEGSTPNTGLDFLAANSVSLSLESSLEPNKILGSARLSNDFSHNSPQKATLSLEYYPMVGNNSVSRISSQTGVLALTGDYQSGHYIRFGNFELRQCYLNSLNIKLSPHSPVVFSANFDVYNLSQVTGQSFSGANITNTLTSGSGAYLDSLHATAVGISGSGASLPSSKAEIDVTFSCNRSPQYALGATSPSTVILDSAQKQITIRGENIGEVCGFSGNNAILNLYFSPLSSFVTGGTGFSAIGNSLFSIGTTGRVSSQNLSADENGLVGSVSILQSIF